MVLSVSDAWKSAVTRPGAEITWLVDMELGPAGFLTVVNASAGAGDTVTVTLNGGVIVTLTEGSNFASGATNSICATAIAAAINGHGTLGPLVVAKATGALVHVIAYNDTITSISLASSDTSAWTATPDPLSFSLGFAKSTVPVGNRWLSVSAVNPFASTLDHITREVRTGDVEIHFADDGALRDVFDRCHPKGKRVVVKLGEASLAESDYAAFGTYAIDDWHPEPGGITVRCIEPYGFALDDEITGEFFNVHPLAAMSRILTLAKVPSSFIDSASFDSTDSRYDTISHWSVGRHNRHFGTESFLGNPGPKTAITEPTKAQDLLNDLSGLLTGNIRVQEDGKLTFVRYDSNASVARAISLTADASSDFEPNNSAENVATRVALAGIIDNTPNGSSDRAQLYQASDSFALASVSTTGTNRNFTTTLESDWIGTYGYLQRPISSGDTTMLVWDCEFANMAGTRQDTNPSATTSSFSQRSADQLGSGRYAYLLITDGRTSEIVEAEGFSHPGSSYGGTVDPDVYAAGGYTITGIDSSVYVAPSLTAIGGEYNYWKLGQFTIRTRGVKGTTAQAWTPTYANGLRDGNVRVYDITIAIDAVEQRLLRFAYGCPTYKIRTSMEHWDLQLGDFITITSDIYLNFQKKNGADSSVVWEIISKETQIADDSPAVIFTLARVRDDITPIAVPTNDPLPPPYVVVVPVTDSILSKRVDVATTDALPAATYDDATQTLTATSNGALGAVDGYSPAAGESILVRNQATAKQNGIYTVTNAGDGSHPWSFTRRSDATASGQFPPGLTVAVVNGTAYGGHVMRLSTSGSITLDTTSLTFSDTGSAGVTGPGSSTAHRLAAFADTTGAVLEDSGVTTSSVSTAITQAAGAAQKSANLSDLASASTARTNLGLGGAAVLSVGTSAGTVAAGDDSRITGALQASNNLSDIANAATARSNLGLGGAAVLDVGLASGTVAAGNDLRLGFFRARLATTAALPSCTYSSGVLTATANGALSVDSKTVNASDIILVYQQTTATNNGLYTVTATGSAGAPWVLTRSTALNTSAQWTNGLMFYAWDGTATTGNLRKWFVCTNTGAITLDTTNLTFAEAFLSSLSTASAIFESGGTTLSIASIADAELFIRAGATVDGVALGDLAQSGGALQVTQARGLRETSGPTTLAMGAVADAYLLSRSGSSIIGVPTGTSSGVALYADERFDDLTDTINFVTANSGATDLTGNGIFQGITGSGGGSNGTSRYGRYRRNTTGAVSGNTQYQSNTVTDAYLQMGPRLIFKQAISRTTNIRAFVGYSTASAPQGMSADDTAGATIGFQYSTPRGDTSIRFIWDDGTTQGTDSTGVSFTADVPLVFVIDWDRVNAKVTGRIYSTSGSAWSQVYSKTQSTGLPADSTSFYIGAGVQTQAASAVYIDTYYWRAKIRGL